MRKRLRLGGEILADICIGVILGILSVLAVLVLGTVLTGILAGLFVGILLVCIVVVPLLALLVGVCLLIGYPISSGRIVKQKLQEFKVSLEVPRRGNLTEHGRN